MCSRTHRCQQYHCPGKKVTVYNQLKMVLLRVAQFHVKGDKTIKYRTWYHNQSVSWGGGGDEGALERKFMLRNKMLLSFKIWHDLTKIQKDSNIKLRSRQTQQDVENLATILPDLRTHKHHGKISVISVTLQQCQQNLANLGKILENIWRGLSCLTTEARKLLLQPLKSTFPDNITS